MLEFIGVYNLDIAVCGNDFVNSQNDQLMGTRKLPGNLILEDQKFIDDFPDYHQFMRTIWGKLFKLSVLEGISEYRSNFFNLVSYGLDTLFSMYAFRKAKRVGILSKSLHQYYISPKSSSYKFSPNRIVSDQILHEKTLDFLKSKCGSVSPRSEDFLYVVYMNAVSDTVNVLLHAKLPVSDKMQRIHEIFTHEYTRKLAGLPHLGKLNGLDKEEDRRWLFGTVVKWMLDQEKARSGEGFSHTVDVLAAMRACPSDIPGWPGSGKLNIWIALRKKYVEESIPTHPVDTRIRSLFDTSPLLKSIPAEHAGFLRSAVVPVMGEDYPAAMDALFALAEDGDIPDEYAESYILLGQNVCAAAEYADGWVFFGKLWIHYLYENTRFDEARAELNKLIQLLPDDEDFIALRKMLIS